MWRITCIRLLELLYSGFGKFSQGLVGLTYSKKDVGIVADGLEDS
jgi:hypothetical protein